MGEGRRRSRMRDAGAAFTSNWRNPNLRRAQLIDVILVHRLLKNPVGIPEYVLLSEELYRIGEESLPAPVHEISPELEGFGTVRAYFVDVGDLEDSLPPLPAPSWQGRLGRTAVAVGVGLPYMVGLRRPRHAAAAR
jgi:hypothetical protein